MAESYKIINRFKFERIWGKVMAKNVFPRQSWRKYLKQSSVFIIYNL